jgi:hypothetical protein
MPAERESGAELVQSVYRVAELPIVASMCGGIVGVYGRVKNAPVPLVGRSLGAAEATAEWAVARAYPYALKFEKPIMYVDSLACKGLDALESTVPIVKKAPDQMIADAKAYISDMAQAPVNMVTRVKDVGVAKVGVATEFGRDKLIQAAKNVYAQRALQNIDTYVATVDSYVDKYIPAEGSEDEGVVGFENGEENWDPALAPIVHAAALTNKIRRRIYKLTLAKAHAAQKKCTDALMDNIPTTGTNLLDYVRAQLASGSHVVTEATNLIWKETASLTPGKAAQAVTAGLNVIEARSAIAARALFQFLTLSYNPEEPVAAAPAKVERKEQGEKKKHKHQHHH